MLKSLLYILTFSFFLCSIPSIGQAELVQQAEVDEIKKDKDYWYADLPLERPKATKSDKLSWSIPAFLGDVLTFLMWGLVLFAIVLVLYYLLKNVDFNWNQKTESEAINPSQEIASERDLWELNYAQLVKEAIHNKDYRMATRWYYLWVLKELSVKERIVYDKFKTNNEYKQKLMEVLGNQHKYLPVFGKIVKYYEYMWFGNFAVSEEQFVTMEEEFKRAIHTI